MTTKAFIEKLARKYRRKGIRARLVAQDSLISLIEPSRYMIRIGHCCPITFMGRGCPPVDEVDRVGRHELGLTGRQIHNIISAADGEENFRNLRHKLLVAVGLEK